MWNILALHIVLVLIAQGPILNFKFAHIQLTTCSSNFSLIFNSIINMASYWIAKVLQKKISLECTQF